MITKLCYLDSQGQFKFKIFKIEKKDGIRQIKSQFLKYNPSWSRCNFCIYYQDIEGAKKMIQNDEQLHKYMRNNQKPKLWAERSEVSLLCGGEQFQDLNESQIILEKQTEKVWPINNQSVIINRGEPPLFLKKHQLTDNASHISVLREQNDLFKGVRKQKHFGVSCASCQLDDIEGARFHCLICYRYDICQKCEPQATFEHQHPLLKIVSPEKMFTKKHLQIIKNNIASQLLENSKIIELDQTERQMYKSKIRQLQSSYVTLLEQMQRSQKPDKIKNPEQKAKQIMNGLKKIQGIGPIIEKTEKTFNRIGKNIQRNILPLNRPNHQKQRKTMAFEECEYSFQQILKEKQQGRTMQIADILSTTLNIQFNEGLILAKRHSNKPAEKIIDIYLAERYK